MDKQILEYLDKVGEKIGGVAKEGFDVYVHGVFVESLIMSIIGLLFIIVPISVIVISYKKIKLTEDVINSEGDISIAMIFVGVLFILSIVIGLMTLSSYITGVFAPDYVAIKDIVEGVR
ncbi:MULTISPECIES: hypothetical protein [Staphylococcus]|uniref:hypothetical protein n=1 Tax=Staphylococcus TaxID=1279 RepID=UPI0008A1C3E3|nr:hypothetical protein [Staphylococcus sp. HMSC057A08]OFS46618.1 hypothetical protein HMPREF2881_01270 [Staphylococcus sp. HMSC057A08]